MKKTVLGLITAVVLLAGGSVFIAKSDDTSTASRGMTPRSMDDGISTASRGMTA
ncbi:hypothetical protein MOE86_19990 [Bacillus atrophaeus]|uniref:hypothetical protein n=1 Tax=Bacillus atrophaeus TaxID=1452 RepID=UPI00227E83AF|nr:hypothetical protein [Bacillus atrophaeus]MCY9198912.1 hypothetical protein [Bacillus atrophaeus]